MIYLNGQPVNTTLFPDNTSQVWQIPDYIIKETNWVHIVWEFSNEGEFLHLAQLKDLLDESQIGCALKIKYLPYGRQDKHVSNTTTFGLRTFANLLNKLHFSEINIVDPHSSVALDLIHNSKAKYPTEEVDNVYELTKADVICYPDKGAKDKYLPLYDYPSIHAEKIRDQSTGEITSMKIPYAQVKDKTILICDDICDGGTTFTKLTELLIASGAKQVNLFVTHGIFSKGLRVLYDSGIKRIFTIDGEISEYQNNISYRRL